MSKGNRKRRKALGLLPTREKCAARNRFGEPCGKYPMLGSVVCENHGGSAPQVKRKAQERIAMAQDDAASLLVQFMASEKVPFAERRRCAEFLLSYETRNEVKLQVARWEGMLDEVFVDYTPEGETSHPHEDVDSPQRPALSASPTPFPAGVPSGDAAPPRYNGQQT